MTTILTHHHLTAEEVNDQHGNAIVLTQQDGDNQSDIVMVHPWQLRAVCEQFGIISSDPQAEKTIATLQRRMVALASRIGDLAIWMAKHSDHKHADLSYELTTINALADIANEWVADFDEPVQQVITPCSSTLPASAPAQATLL